MSIRKKKKSKLAQAKARVNSKYWRNKADAEITHLHTGKPCEVCKSQGRINTYLTCGHHVVAKSLCANLRHHKDNIVDLCSEHHLFSNELAAHSSNPLAIQAWITWLEIHKIEAYHLLLTYKQFTSVKPNYKEAYEKLKEGS